MQRPVWITLLLPLLLASPAAHAGGHHPAALSWSARYPAAAKGLADWKARYPAASGQLLAWDDQEPTHSRDFLVWVLTHAGDNFDLFIQGHRDWAPLVRLVSEEHKAMEAFALWLQSDSAAARALTTHLRALSKA